MGNQGITSFLNNDNSFNYLLRTLSVESKPKNKIVLKTITNYGMDIGMVVAPLLTYFFQINKFNKTKSSKGFSKLICFLLFMGNIFRIFFWYGLRFQKTLLFQSIGIVIFQIILIHLCIKYQEKTNPDYYLSDPNNYTYKTLQQNTNYVNPIIYHLLQWKRIFNIKMIWKWAIEIDYYRFMLVIFVVLCLLSQIFFRFKIFFHIIGVLSAIFESCTCLPQVIENYKTKNPKNVVSFSMIFCWFLGDSFRLFYYKKFKAPLQMIIAISVQVTLDFIVCAQIYIYRRISKNKGNNTAKRKIEQINKLMKKIDELNTLTKKKEDSNTLHIVIKKKIML